MVATTAPHFTAVRHEHASGYGRGNVTVMCEVTCTVCGGHGRFGRTPEQVAELVALWDWHQDCRRHRDEGTLDLTPYMRRMAEGMIRSLDHYGNRSPAVGDGVVSTPAYYTSALMSISIARGDTLPGNKDQWWGYRWAEYAHRILRDRVAVLPEQGRCPATGRSATACTDSTHTTCSVGAAESRALDEVVESGHRRADGSY